LRAGNLWYVVSTLLFTSAGLIVSASLFKAPGISAKLKQVHGAFKLADSSCRTALEDCQKKLDGHIKIRDWISEDKSVSAYLKMRDLVDLRKFPGCGQWLLDSESYQIWDDGSSEVLCISGTGKSHMPNLCSC
jgi:hypothetical protein